jgi:hypothetical protein
MKTNPSIAASLGLCACTFALSACGVPDLNLGPPPNPTANESDIAANARGGRVNQVIERVICELTNAAVDEPGLRRYVAVGEMTLKVEDGIGLTPSLSLINPLPIAGTSESTVASAEVSRGRIRSYTHDFAILMKDLPQKKCDPRTGSSLTGDLGLAEIVRAGLSGTAITEGGAWRLKEKSYFASTVTFSFKTAASGGPSVSRSRFKGYGGNNGLANMSRTGTDSLTISFAPLKTPEGPTSLLEQSLLLGVPEDKRKELLDRRAEEDAVAAARDLLQRVLLERINLNQP